MTSYTKDIVTHFGATNADSDISTAWGSFADFCRGCVGGDIVTLAVPAHVYTFSDNNLSMCPGVLGGLTVAINIAPGATFTGVLSFLCNKIGVREDNLHSSRVATANVGATSVRLLTPSEHTRYVVTQWISVTGPDVQGTGSPPNPAWCEFRQITAIDTVTGVISFTTPLANDYLSTSPLYDGGSSGSLDYGGPATIYAMPEDWDIDVTYNMPGGTLTCSGQMVPKGRRFTLTGRPICTDHGIVPSVNQFHSCDADQSACTVEVDKMVETLIYPGGSVGQHIFQSMGCAADCYFTNFDVAILNGTPRRLTVTGGSIDEARLGATSFGCTDALTINNCVVSSVAVNSVTVSDVDGAAGYTMAGGVIRCPISNGVPTWAIPGTYCYFSGSKANEGNGFRVLAVTSDGTNVIVVTTAAGGFPNIPRQGGTILSLHAHPCPVWNGTGNTGCDDIVDLSQFGAQGRPLFAYSKRTYTGGVAGGLIALPASVSANSWGRLSQVKVTVIQAYTGVQSTLTMSLLGSGALDPDNTISGWNPVFNLKQTGLRTITAGAVSVQAGDSVSVPGNIWFDSATPPITNHDVSGEAAGLWPIVEVEVVCAQGLLSAVAPLRLRLHS